MHADLAGLTLTEDLDNRLRHLYQVFFSSDCKQAQDKIRNKNSVFKQLYSITLQEMQQLRDAVSQAVAQQHQMDEEQTSAARVSELQDESEARRVELERCQAKAIKIIFRMQASDQNMQELHQQLS